MVRNNMGLTRNMFFRIQCIVLVIAIIFTSTILSATPLIPKRLTASEKTSISVWIVSIVTSWLIEFIAERNKPDPIPENPYISAMHYLFTNKEKRTFKKLVTEVEKRQFINSYWQKRDASPGTPENELRNDYYNRVTLAMKRYGNPLNEGWKTDQGRVIIIYGEPDAIYHYNFHVSEGLAQAHFNSFLTLEFWIYNRPQGPTPVPYAFSELNPGIMFFVFDQSMGNLQCSQIFSTEFGEIIDNWLY